MQRLPKKTSQLLNYILKFRTLKHLKNLTDFVYAHLRHNLTIMTPKDNSPLINQRAVAGLEVIIRQNTGRTHGDAVAV
jgi:hypothetical protein